MPISPTPPSGTKTSSSLWFLAMGQFSPFERNAGSIYGRRSPAHLLWSASGAGRCPKMYVARSDCDATVVFRADDQSSSGVDGFKDATQNFAVLVDGDWCTDTCGRGTPACQHIADAATIVPKAECLDPCVTQRLEYVIGCAIDTQIGQAGRGIWQILRGSADIDADANGYRVAAVRNFGCFETDTDQLGTVGQNVIGPLQRDAAIAVEPVSAIDANFDRSRRQHARECRTDGDTRHKA